MKIAEKSPIGHTYSLNLGTPPYSWSSSSIAVVMGGLKGGLHGDRVASLCGVPHAAEVKHDLEDYTSSVTALLLERQRKLKAMLTPFSGFDRAFVQFEFISKIVAVAPQVLRVLNALPESTWEILFHRLDMGRNQEDAPLVSLQRLRASTV